MKYGTVIIKTKLDTKSFDKQIEEVEYRLKEIDYELSHAKELKLDKRTIQEFELQAEKLNNQLIKLRKNQSDISKIDLTNVSSGLTKVVNKVGKWALAVFGVRSAYMAIRNAINVISQDDEQLKSDIDYIKNVMAYTLEPVVRRIVELAKQLVLYLGYLIKSWFKYDIFANANKNLKKATGSAKELKRQLAGFDEMNILQDTNSGGSSAITNMSLDNFNAPKWLQMISKYGKFLLPILGGIFAKLFKIKKLGIATAIYGIYKTIKGIIDFAHDPSFENFANILEGVAITAIGIGATIGAWPVVLGGILAYIIIQLVKNFDEIKEKFKDLRKWLDENVLTWLKEHFGKVGEFLYIPIQVAIGIIEDLFDGFIGGIKLIIDGIVKIFNGDFIGGIKNIFGGLLSIILAPFKSWYNAVREFLYDILNLFGLLKGTSSTGGGYGSYGSGSGGGRAKGGIFYPNRLPKLAVGGIINYPGRGVPYNGAYIGERGAEAVVPLTDSQQMALLGEAIGKYININATVPVYVGNRMVAREIKRINAEDNFAYNR